jgi:hypothetical protein
MTAIAEKPDATTGESTPSPLATDLTERVEQRVTEQTTRFLYRDPVTGRPVYSPVALAALIVQITNEEIETVLAELTTADDQVRHLVDVLVGTIEERDRLRASNQRLRVELSGREPVT